MRYAAFLVLGATLTVIAATIGKRLFFRALLAGLSRGD